MIGNITKGSGMSGLLAYLLAERDHSGDLRERHEVIGGTVAGRDEFDLSRQFAVFRRLNPEAVNPVVHCSLRLPPGESLTKDEWRELGEEWAQRMGYDAHTVVWHGDHIHVAASRIKADGKLVSGWMDFRKAEQIIRDLEREFGLRQIEPSHLLEPARAATHRRAPSLNAIEMHERTGKIAPSLIVGAALDEVLSRGPLTAVEFVDQLAERGIEARPNLATTGKLFGFAYKIDGQLVKANAIGRGYTFQNLQKKGLQYEFDQSHELARRRDASSDRESGRSPVDSRADQDARSAVERGGDDASGGSQADRGADRDARSESGPGAIEDRVAAAGGGRSGEADRGGPGAGAEPGGFDEIDARRSRGDQKCDQVADRHADSDPRPSASPDRAHRSGALDYRHEPSFERLRMAAGGVPPALIEQVKTVFEVLPDDEYRIQVGDAPESSVLPDDLLAQLGDLARQNVAGRNVRFAPVSTRYVLLSEITAENAEKARQEGFEPAFEVETSPDRRDLWISLGEPVSDSIKLRVRDGLATKYDAKPDRLGSMPGFACHNREKRLVARVVDALGTVASNAAWAIERAKKLLADRLRRLDERLPPTAPQPEQSKDREKPDLAETEMEQPPTPPDSPDSAKPGDRRVGPV